MSRNGGMPSADLVNELVTGLAEMAGISVELVHSNDRRHAVAWVRAMACKWLAAHEANYSSTGIGKRLGLDHSTVLYHLRRTWSSNSGKLKSRPMTMAKYLVHRYGHAAASTPRKKRTKVKLKELLVTYESTGSKIFTADIARALSISSSGAANLLSGLCDEGQIRRISLGMFAIVPKVKAEPVAPIVLPAAFIRPIPLSRMMAGKA